MQSNFNGGLAPLAPWPPGPLWEVRSEAHLHRLLVLGAAAAGQAAGPLGAGGAGGEALGLALVALVPPEPHPVERQVHVNKLSVLKLS